MTAFGPESLTDIVDGREVCAVCGSPDCVGGGSRPDLRESPYYFPPTSSYDIPDEETR
jgi:hypothetical protein